MTCGQCRYFETWITEDDGRRHGYGIHLTPDGQRMQVGICQAGGETGNKGRTVNSQTQCDMPLMYEEESNE